MNNYLINLLQTHSFFSLIVALFVAYACGVITSFTPCIFPMIPITFSVITSVGGGGDTLKKRLRALLTYGCGLSLSYVLLGMVAVLGGGFFGSLTQELWVKIIMANVFFLIALNTMGWIRIKQFQFQNQKITSYKSLILIGFLTGFSLSPCTLPALAIVLSFASHTSLWIGTLMLWAYAWGFFTLLLLFGMFGMSFKEKLPKSGSWLKVVEWILFLMCFGIGEWLLIS